MNLCWFQSITKQTTNKLKLVTKTTMIYYWVLFGEQSLVYFFFCSSRCAMSISNVLTMIEIKLSVCVNRYMIIEWLIMQNRHKLNVIKQKYIHNKCVCENKLIKIKTQHNLKNETPKMLRQTASDRSEKWIVHQTIKQLLNTVKIVCYF